MNAFRHVEIDSAFTFPTWCESDERAVEYAELTFGKSRIGKVLTTNQKDLISPHELELKTNETKQIELI